MAHAYEECRVCHGTGIEPGKENLPESRIGGNNDCYFCFGMGSVLPIYQQGWPSERATKFKAAPKKNKRVRVTTRPTEVKFFCHAGCIAADGQICLCKCQGANHGVVRS